MQDHRSNLALVFFVVREQTMKLPNIFFPGNLLITATHLLVFPRKKLDVTGIALAEGQAMTVWSHVLHQELEQEILR
jgi:hypothetical protein